MLVILDLKLLLYDIDNIRFAADGDGSPAVAHPHRQRQAREQRLARLACSCCLKMPMVPHMRAWVPCDERDDTNTRYRKAHSETGAGN
jgi:hypothetical protein